MAIELMTTFSGARTNFAALKQFSKEYGLHGKKLAEFTELDKAIYQSIKQFSKIV